jgi:hypothetical protein
MANVGRSVAFPENCTLTENLTLNMTRNRMRVISYAHSYNWE